MFGTTLAVTGVDDTTTNVYAALDSTVADQPELSVFLFSVAAPVSDIPTVSWTISGTSSDQIGILMEVSGLAALAFDRYAAMQETTESAMDSGDTSSIAQADEVVFGFGLTRRGEGTSSMTPGAGFTDIDQTGGGTLKVHAEYKIVSAIGSESAQMTNNGSADNSLMACATFKLLSDSGSGVSDLLDASAFALTIPPTSELTGIEVTVNGKQSTTAGATILTILPLTENYPATPLTFQLPTSDGSFVLGSPTDQWGEYWSRDQVDNPVFGFSIQASALDGTEVTFDISGVEVTAWYTPPNIHNFNYVKTLQFTDGETLTLALDDSGVFWQENIESGPNVLMPFFTAIEPDTFAKSVTEDDREFIALSDLAMGTDMPRQYNGQWVDRISQVGPAAAPSVTFSTTEYDIVSITQAPPTDFGSNDYTLVWSANAGTTASGNTITIQAADGKLADVIAAGVGATIVLAGIPTQNGQDPNGTYIVTACGTVPTARYGSASPYFSVTATIFEPR